VTESTRPPDPEDDGGAAASWVAKRREVVRTSLAIGVAVGAYGASFGAIGVTNGLSVAQTCALSVLAFTGGSQFAFVGVLAGGGSAIAGAASALLLGTRNSFYAVRMTALLKVRGGRRLVAAQLTIDESVAIATAQRDDRTARLAFWTTGTTVFVAWNLATLAGAVAGARLGDPRTFGLDAVAPAAFLAFLWPRLRGRDGRRAQQVAGAAALIAIATTLVLPPGLPVLLAAAPAVWAGLRTVARSPGVGET
jgi:predicted branched-subunit amino acid permease